MIIWPLPVAFNCRQMLKVRADRRKNGRLRKYHYSKIQNAGDCVARTGVREIGFKFGSLPHDPGGITCMQLNSYFIWRLLRIGERKFVQMVLVTWPRWPPRPYMVKTLQKSSSPEPEGRWPWDLVCSIGVVGPTKFVQMMILGWSCPT